MITVRGHAMAMDEEDPWHQRGPYYVLPERLRVSGGKGYTVRASDGRVIYHLKNRSEAEKACGRLNEKVHNK